MTAKISVFAVVLIVACVSGDLDDYTDTPTLASMYTVPPIPVVQNTGLYPSTTPIYNEYKKSIYSLNQALGNICFTAQGAFNYYSLYKKNQQLYDSDLDARTKKFNKALKYFDNELKKYRQSLVDYQLSLAYQNPTPKMCDDILLHPDLLL